VSSTLTPVSSGLTSHGAPSQTPGIIAAPHPGGTGEYHPCGPLSIRYSLNASGAGGLGSVIRPEANVRA